jgi:hypothetical protein
MEKRDFSKWNSKRVEVDQAQDEPATVRLVLQKNIILNVKGPVTGIVYHFNRGGSVVAVDARDAPLMLEKKPSGACCSGTIGSPYFVLAEGR